MNLHSATQWSHCYCRTGTRRLLNKRQIHLSSRLDTAEFLPSPTVCQGLSPFARLYVRIYRSDRFTCAAIDWLVHVFSLLVYVWNPRPPPSSLPRHLNSPFDTLGKNFIQRHVSLMYATIDRPMISFNDSTKAPMDSTWSGSPLLSKAKLKTGLPWSKLQMIRPSFSSRFQQCSVS